MSLTRSSRRLLLTLVLVASGLTISSAKAYPDRVNTGPGGSRLCRDDARNVGFHLADAGGWSGPEQAFIRGGSSDWSTVRDYDARPLVTLTEGGGIKVYPNDAGPNIYGSASCEPDVPGLGRDAMWVSSNPTFADDEAFYRNVARHEMGHMLGLEHSGNRDSEVLDRRVPTMATCIASGTEEFRQKSLSQDDAEYLTHVHSDLGRTGISPQAPFHANVGFEQGLSYWGHQGGAIDLRPVGGATGPAYIGFRADTANDYVYQTATVRSGKGRAQAKLNHEQEIPLSPGQLKVTLWRRPVGYRGDNRCSYPYVKSMNDPEIGGPFQLVAESPWVSPAADWSPLASSLYELGGTGHQLQVRVFSTVKEYPFPGPGPSRLRPGTVRLDNIRAQCGFSNNLGECVN